MEAEMTVGRNRAAPFRKPALASRERPPGNGQPVSGGTWQREELLHLLTLSGTLAGLCITGVTLFHTMGRSSLPQTIADDTLAVSALLQLVCTYVIFFALRTRSEKLARALERSADALFFFGLTGMVASGLIMVYTVW
jgi:hypothetical protein